MTTLEELYQWVRRAILNKPNLPEPRRANFEDVDKLVIARNRWRLSRRDAELKALMEVTARQAQEIEALQRVTRELQTQIATRSSDIRQYPPDIQTPRRLVVPTTIFFILNALGVPAVAEILVSFTMLRSKVAMPDPGRDRHCTALLPSLPYSSRPRVFYIYIGPNDF